MSNELLQNLVNELSRMSLEKITLFLLRVNQPEAEKLVSKIPTENTLKKYNESFV